MLPPQLELENTNKIEALERIRSTPQRYEANRLMLCAVLEDARARARRKREEEQAHQRKEKEEEEAKARAKAGHEQDDQQNGERKRGDRSKLGARMALPVTNYDCLHALGLLPSAMGDIPRIKATFRRLALRNHPDMGGDIETFKTVNHAYTRLVKLKRRGRA